MVNRRAMSNGLLARDIKTFPLTLILSVVGDSSIIAVCIGGSTHVPRKLVTGIFL